MNASLPSNGKNSALTPSIEPLPQSEGELLKFREDKAKAALRETSRKLGQNLLSFLNPVETVREHPWKSSGAAALAGFVVALKVVPSTEEKTNPVPSEAPPAPSGPSPWSTLTSTLIETGSGVVKAALMPWLVQKIQDFMPKQEPTAESESPEETKEAPSAP